MDNRQCRIESLKRGEISISVISLTFWRWNFRYDTRKRIPRRAKKYTAILLSWRDRSKFRTAEVSELTRRVPERRNLHWEKATDICTRVALSLSWILSSEHTGCDSMRNYQRKKNCRICELNDSHKLHLAEIPSHARSRLTSP